MFPSDMYIPPSPLFYLSEWLGMIPYPPEMHPGVWSFNPANGVLKVMDDSLTWPNGVALSPDGSTLYVTHTPINLTGAPQIVIDVTVPRFLWNENVIDI